MTNPNEELTFGLRLTEPELKVTYTALCSLRDDLGHEEADVRRIVQAVIGKLPDEHAITSIRLPEEHHRAAEATEEAS